MPYITNFHPDDYGNHQQVLDEVNKRFGTDLEIRTHPMADKYRPGTEDMWSLWSPHDWVRVQKSEFPYSYTDWWDFYIAHIWRVGVMASHDNQLWSKERQRYRDAGQGMDTPHDKD